VRFSIIFNFKSDVTFVW